MILKDEPLADEARGELIRELEAWEVDEGSGIDCPEEALRIFVPLVLDSLQHPFVSNLPCNHRKNWKALIGHLLAVAKSLELINAHHH